MSENILIDDSVVWYEVEYHRGPVRRGARSSLGVPEEPDEQESAVEVIGISIGEIEVDMSGFKGGVFQDGDEIDAILDYIAELVGE